MSENNSFIEEVTEEVKKDKVFLFLKKYGWIGILIIIGIVVGSIVNEIRLSSYVKETRDTGNQLADLLNEINNEKLEISSHKDHFESLQPLVKLLLIAKNSKTNYSVDEAVEAYRAILALDQVENNIKDYARFQLFLLLEANSTEASELLSDLIAPDNAFRLLALEQQVLIDIQNRDFMNARSNIEIILNEPNSSEMLLNRVNQIKRAIEVFD